MNPVRLRHVARINPPSPAFEQLAADRAISFLPMERVWPDNRLDLTEQRSKTSVMMGYTRFESGDILVPKITPTFEASRAVLVPDLVDGVGAGTTELHVVRPSADVDPRFLTYVFHCHDFLKIGESEMYGVAGQKRVPDDVIRNWRLDLPGLSEQRRIADFLDSAVAVLDAASRKCHALTNLLSERRTVVLLDCILPPEPSDEWSRTRLKYLFESVRNGVWGSDPVGDRTDVTCVRVADFNRDQYLADPGATTRRSLDLGQASEHLLRRGDVLLEKSGGGDQSPVGFAVTFDGANRSVCSNFVAALRVAEGVCPRFAALTMAAFYRAGRNVPYIKQATGIQNLDGLGYLAQAVRIPGIAEQVAIARDLDRELERSLSVSVALGKQIALLSERRRGLITAAVTGQIDVTTARGVDV